MNEQESPKQNILTLTVGLPRSGKSTWAKDKGYPIVSPDAVRLALYGQTYVAEAEKMVWALAHYMVKSLFLAGHTTVILDATNTTRARRDEWKSVLWKRRYMLFQTPKAVCLSRAADRPDLWPVIERMASQFEGIADDEWDALYMGEGTAQETP